MMENQKKNYKLMKLLDRKERQVGGDKIKEGMLRRGKNAIPMRQKLRRELCAGNL